MPDDRQSQFIPQELSVKDIFTQTSYDVPVYQRPYRWEAEPVIQLWTDIIAFYKESPQKVIDQKAKYFLGPIVTCCQNDLNEIIDGQQRITTLKILLFLLLTKLREFKPESMLATVTMGSDDWQKTFDTIAKITNRQKELERCLWEVENEAVDISKPLLSTKVIGEKEKLDEVFSEIRPSDLEQMKTYFREGTFEFSPKIQKNDAIVHLRNRALLNKLIDYEMEEGGFKGVPKERVLLVVSNLVLNCCKLLTIRCDSRDSALRIFNTLNARGQLLASSDILKARIFSEATKLGSIGEQTFIDKWSIFTKIVNKYAFKTSADDSSYDAMFRYLMHIDRSTETVDNTDPGLLKYFDVDHTERMTNHVFDDLIPIAKLWTYISNLANKDFDIDDLYDDISRIIEDDAKKYLLVLSQIQNNPYWRYLVSNFYWRFFIRENNPDLFKEKFPLFLKYLTAFTIAAMLVPKDVKNVFYKQRAKVLSDDIAWMTSRTWWGLSDSYDENKIKDLNSNVGSTGQMSRALILLHAYLDPSQALIEDRFDIEHIFPQDFLKQCKASPSLMSDFGMTEDNIEICLQSFGNKMALEKDINISAGNNPWPSKSKIYLGDEPWHKNKPKDKHQTQYQEALYLANLPQIKQWTKFHIDWREQDFLKKILSFLSDPEHDFSTWQRPDYIPQKVEN